MEEKTGWLLVLLLAACLVAVFLSICNLSVICWMLIEMLGR